MMKNKTIFITIFVMVLGAVIYGKTEFSPEKAKLVDMTLKRIAKNRKPRVFLRKITFSESELNSYLNLIYVKKYSPEVKYINLQLKENNYVSGEMKVKLVGKKYNKVPAFLRDINVETEGIIQCKNYRMRFEFEKLRINGTSFAPEVLDEAFGAAQVNYKIKKSMYDWFDLMPGIKKIIVDKRKITLFY